MRKDTNGVNLTTEQWYALIERLRNGTHTKEDIRISRKILALLDKLHKARDLDDEELIDQLLHNLFDAPLDEKNNP